MQLRMSSIILIYAVGITFALDTDLGSAIEIHQPILRPSKVSEFYISDLLRTSDQRNNHETASSSNHFVVSASKDNLKLKLRSQKTEKSSLNPDVTKTKKDLTERSDRYTPIFYEKQINSPKYVRNVDAPWRHSLRSHYDEEDEAKSAPPKKKKCKQQHNRHSTEPYQEEYYNNQDGSSQSNHREPHQPDVYRVEYDDNESLDGHSQSPPFNRPAYSGEQVPKQISKTVSGDSYTTSKSISTSKTEVPDTKRRKVYVIGRPRNKHTYDSNHPDHEEYVHRNTQKPSSNHRARFSHRHPEYNTESSIGSTERHSPVYTHQNPRKYNQSPRSKPTSDYSTTSEYSDVHEQGKYHRQRPSQVHYDSREGNTRAPYRHTTSETTEYAQSYSEKPRRRQPNGPSQHTSIEHNPKNPNHEHSDKSPKRYRSRIGTYYSEGGNSGNFPASGEAQSRVQNHEEVDAPPEPINGEKYRLSKSVSYSESSYIDNPESSMSKPLLPRNGETGQIDSEDINGEDIQTSYKPYNSEYPASYSNDPHRPSRSGEDHQPYEQSGEHHQSHEQNNGDHPLYEEDDKDHQPYEQNDEGYKPQDEEDYEPQSETPKGDITGYKDEYYSSLPLELDDEFFRKYGISKSAKIIVATSQEPNLYIADGTKLKQPVSGNEGHRSESNGEDQPESQKRFPGSFTELINTDTKLLRESPKTTDGRFKYDNDFFLGSAVDHGNGQRIQHGDGVSSIVFSHRDARVSASNPKVKYINPTLKGSEKILLDKIDNVYTKKKVIGVVKMNQHGDPVSSIVFSHRDARVSASNPKVKYINPTLKRSETILLDKMDNVDTKKKVIGVEKMKSGDKQT